MTSAGADPLPQGLGASSLHRLQAVARHRGGSGPDRGAGSPPPFAEWGKIFPDPAMTLAAVDRLVHHATILELNVESYRRRSALEKKRGPGRPPTRATPKTIE